MSETLLFWQQTSANSCVGQISHTYSSGPPPQVRSGGAHQSRHSPALVVKGSRSECVSIPVRHAGEQTILSLRWARSQGKHREVKVGGSRSGWNHAGNLHHYLRLTVARCCLWLIFPVNHLIVSPCHLKLIITGIFSFYIDALHSDRAHQFACKSTSNKLRKKWTYLLMTTHTFSSFKTIEWY